MGGGVIAATVGIIIAIFAALFGLIWFPLKKPIKKEKKKELENLINYFLLISSVIIIYEFSRYVQFIKTVETNLSYKKILKLFNFKNISDFRKEKLILNYSRSLFIFSIKIFINAISILFSY